MIKIVDKYKTKYFAKHMQVDLEILITDTKETIDIGGAKIAYDSMKVINQAIADGINVIDSEDPVRNNLLIESKRRLASRVETIPFPKVKKMDEVPDLIRNLNVDETYLVANTREDFLLMTIATVTRPKLRFVLDGCWMAYFTFVRQRLEFGFRKWSKWNYTSGNTIVSIEEDQNGLFYVPGKKKYDYDSFKKEECCLPYIFGTETWKKEPCLDHLRLECMDELEGALAFKRKTIKDVI